MGLAVLRHIHGYGWYEEGRVTPLAWRRLWWGVYKRCLRDV